MEVLRPFVSGLSADQLQQLMRYIVDNKVTVTTALKALGFANLIRPEVALEAIKTAAAQGASIELRALAANAVAAAAEAASSWLAWLTGAVPMISLGTILWGVVIGAAVIGIGGFIYYHNRDRMVEKGPQWNQPHGARITDFEKQPGRPMDRYYIYAVNTSGWSLYVGRPSDVEGRPSSSFADGGTGDQPVAFKRLVDTPFDSREKAIEHIKAGVSKGHQSVWTGTWVKFGGEEYRTVHVGEIGG